MRDSDGKLDQFIDRRDVKRTLPLHRLDGPPCCLGVFLVGAYQEILGDLHNLLGDTHAVHVSLDANDDDTAALSPASNAPSPFTLAARSEDSQRLAQSLQTLDFVYREALVLRFQEDLSLQEIATVVGAPVSTVASRIYRGLATLRAQLDGGKHES